PIVPILIPHRNNSFSSVCRRTNFTTGGFSLSVDLWLKSSGYGSVSKRRFWITYISANCVHSLPFPILYSCSAFLIISFSKRATVPALSANTTLNVIFCIYSIKSKFFAYKYSYCIIIIYQTYLSLHYHSVVYKAHPLFSFFRRFLNPCTSYI